MNDVQHESSIHGESPANRIRILNDQFRTEGIGRGSVFVTSGVQSLGDDFIRAALLAVRTFEDFSKDNDPWHEHDCAVVTVQGEKLIWKIDYYDKGLKYGSEDPSNENITHRVLTVMLASEY